MTNSSPRPSGRLRLRVASALGVLVLALASAILAALAPGANAGHPVDSDSNPVADSRIGPAVCTMLGRAFVKHEGCSRTACLSPHDVLRRNVNAETCYLGSRTGRAYARPIDSRRCKALHRIWVPSVNLCVSNPHRGLRLIVDAPQCQAPYTDYVTLTEEEGYYDLCMTPHKAEQIHVLAQRDGKTLFETAAETNRALCSYRPRGEFVNGRCRTATGPIPKQDRGGVVLIGDSVSWRGQNELSARRPSWTLDGVPYRKVAVLLPRVGYYAKSHGGPAGLIVALGTNPSTGWTEADYAKALNRVQRHGIVMYVTPFRTSYAEKPGAAVKTGEYAGWMKQIARSNKHVCVADWRRLAYHDRQLLIDGVHQTQEGERVWAEFISKSWEQCLAVVAQQDAQSAAGTGTHGGTGSTPGDPSASPSPSDGPTSGNPGSGPILPLPSGLPTALPTALPTVPTGLPTGLPGL